MCLHGSLGKRLDAFIQLLVAACLVALAGLVFSHAFPDSSTQALLFPSCTPCLPVTSSTQLAPKRDDSANALDKVPRIYNINNCSPQRKRRAPWMVLCAVFRGAEGVPEPEGEKNHLCAGRDCGDAPEDLVIVNILSLS